jgi:hypothetical protein
VRITCTEGESSGTESTESIGLPALLGRASKDSSSDGLSACCELWYRFGNGSGVNAPPLSSCSSSTMRPPASGVPFSIPRDFSVCPFVLSSSLLTVDSSAPLSFSTEEELIEIGSSFQCTFSWMRLSQRAFQDQVYSTFHLGKQIFWANRVNEYSWVADSSERVLS